MLKFILTLLFLFAYPFPQGVEIYDVIIRNGLIYDGSGNQPFQGDVAIQGDTIAAIGNLENAKGKTEIDANGLVVTPGFINMNSMADWALLKDGRSMSDIKQGVTLEVMGEGYSAGPVHRKTAKPVDSLWTTLGGYLAYLEKKGVSTNIASFIGATTVRTYVMKYGNRKPTAEELKRMKNQVGQAMEEGAMGLSASLVYAPANYALTEEIIELAKVASSFGGIYITHMRSESDSIYKALEETFRIAREATIRTEIYHLKINHDRNWNKIDTVLAKIEHAQKSGLNITANMYPYAASNTNLVTRLPLWVQEGGARAMRQRLKDPKLRKKVLQEMQSGIPSKNSEPENVMILGFRLDSLNALYRGKRLDEVAKIHGKSADETLIDLIVKDKSPGAGVFYLQTESNVKKIIQLPYVSFGSDGASMSDIPAFKEWAVHPRTYGTFARVLSVYVRNEKLISLEEAIRRMTSLPASNLNIKKRGRLMTGNFADIAIFNANTIEDQATYENAKVYATGMEHVFVNGVQVLRNGEHTGAKPGRIVRGPGWKK